MNSLVASIAYGSGKAFARYCVWAVRSARVHIEGEVYLPKGPAILAGWHTANLISLSLHYHYFYNYPAACFMPPGIVGVAAHGKLAGFDLQGVELPKDTTGNPAGALKHMLCALNGSNIVVFAVDGPYGPIYRVRPGALWLARASGYPLIPMGFAASPAVRWLRWDHQITPLPGARIAGVLGPPFYVERKRAIDDSLRLELGAVIDKLTARAWDVVKDPGRQQVFSIPASLPPRSQGLLR